MRLSSRVIFFVKGGRYESDVRGRGGEVVEVIVNVRRSTVVWLWISERFIG